MRKIEPFQEGGYTVILPNTAKPVKKKHKGKDGGVLARLGKGGNSNKPSNKPKFKVGRGTGTSARTVSVAGGRGKGGKGLSVLGRLSGGKKNSGKGFVAFVLCLHGRPTARSAEPPKDCRVLRGG